MRSDIWRLNNEYVAAYTENPAVWREVRFPIMAEYYRGGKRIGVQYIVPVNEKRTIQRLFLA